MAGQSFSNCWRKRWRRSESREIGFVIVYVYHITYIHTSKKKKSYKTPGFPPSLRDYLGSAKDLDSRSATSLSSGDSNMSKRIARPLKLLFVACLSISVTPLGHVF